MKKRVLAAIMCSMLAGCLLSACDSNEQSSSTANAEPTQSTTAENSSTEKASEKSTSAATATEASENATQPTTDSIAEATSPDGDNYEFVDETVTNPTTAPIDIPEPSETDEPVSLTADSLAGTYTPLVATNVSDGQEAAFADIFGSSYRESGGSLTINNDGSFAMHMGASIKADKSKGTFTTSNYYLLATYADGSTDTFLYIPSYQNKEVIKTQIGDYYVYFAK